ncbi:flagellar hook-basal body complex protein [Teredinibacter sp. KSP-S5-2]|uniref:flagellar hook-basal body protein n=1 Tax=Teredinibacter sp. KSP-S5-2 TaxID=3034506 RepID=UPI0029347F9A|nr:flagellar hook-basal body complex protein [Teredinibacter sp. KSP-S5-2]WNO11347.1 flagellar hook-basal body complex protein [Teredinibacter sp. KSP-S5-2]
MIDALHVSETGLKANQAWLDYMSNNVANMHTVGYKKTTVNFVDMVSSNNPTPNTSNMDLTTSNHALGTRISTPDVDFSQGGLKNTSRMLDVAIDGNGFFEVQLEDGSLAYTRLGRLQIDDEGYLTINGARLTSSIQIPADVDSIVIEKNGLVLGEYADETSSLELGSLELAKVLNTSSMNSIGNSMYTLKSEDSDVILETPGENGSGTVSQGFIELSNVTLVDEMTNLVLAQRAYQLNARLIQTADQILETINNMRR